jgi:hypothetical protein
LFGTPEGRQTLSSALTSIYENLQEKFAENAEQNYLLNTYLARMKQKCSKTHYDLKTHPTILLLLNCHLCLVTRA